MYSKIFDIGQGQNIRTHSIRTVLILSCVLNQVKTTVIAPSARQPEAGLQQI